MGREKAISILLKNGKLDGIINMESSSWNSGELYSSPRESVNELLKTDACKKYGVYLLLSTDKVYIGQSTDLLSRIKQHIIGKNWWERVIILTTSNDSLDHADIDYLEAKFIELAEKNQHLDCDNRTKGNKIKVTKFRQVHLEEYLSEALVLLELIGVELFSKHHVVKTSNQNDQLKIETIKAKTKNSIDIRNKRETLQYLNEKGFSFNKKACTYARLGDKGLFWMNPRVEYVDENWDIILNNQIDNEIIIIHIPKNTFKAVSASSDDGLLIRKDKPYQLDITISNDDLTDTRSKINFSRFTIDRLHY